MAVYTALQAATGKKPKRRSSAQTDNAGQSSSSAEDLHPELLTSESDDGTDLDGADPVISNVLPPGDSEGEEDLDAHAAAAAVGDTKVQGMQRKADNLRNKMK